MFASLASIVPSFPVKSDSFAADVVASLCCLAFPGFLFCSPVSLQSVSPASSSAPLCRYSLFPWLPLFLPCVATVCFPGFFFCSPVSLQSVSPSFFSPVSLQSVSPGFFSPVLLQSVFPGFFSLQSPDSTILYPYADNVKCFIFRENHSYGYLFKMHNHPFPNCFRKKRWNLC